MDRRIADQLAEQKATEVWPKHKAHFVGALKDGDEFIYWPSRRRGVKTPRQNIVVFADGRVEVNGRA